MKRKTTIYILLLLMLIIHVEAQELPLFHPFKGFRVGITGQAEFIQKPIYIALSGTDPAPLGRWTTGWETGIELAYHFAKYFGISLGINYGTILSYNRDIYTSSIPNENGEWEIINKYEKSFMKGMKDKEILFPVKLEFHYPLRKDLFFAAEAGIKIKGISSRINYGKEAEGGYNTGEYYSTPDDYDPETNTFYPKPYYVDEGYRNLSKIYCDLLMGIGLYYQLPYGDFIRFTTGVNMSFNNVIEGIYKYFLTESYGAFAVKNNFLYTQLSYIHTFKRFKQTKDYRKSQPYSSFNFEKPVHAIGLFFSGGVALNHKIKHTQGVIYPELVTGKFVPELNLKYSCFIKKGWGFSAEIPFGIFEREFWHRFGASHIAPDFEWSNGVVGNNFNNSFWIKCYYFGFSLKASYLAHVHKNISLQTDAGLKWLPFLEPAKSKLWEEADIFSEFQVYDDKEREELVYMKCVPKISAASYATPDLAFSFHVLVHGKNPANNFIFGINTNVSLLDRFYFKYQTTDVLPAHLQSSGEFGWRMTSIGFHIGYQWMRGKKK